jgi:hypothetical protein
LSFPYSYTHLHHTGSQEEIVLVDPADPEAEAQQEVQAQEVPEEEEATEECPDHRPSSFEKGKPRSISPTVCN